MFNTQQQTQQQRIQLRKSAKTHNTQKQMQKQHLKQRKLKKLFYTKLNNNYITL
jgi:hypothetical protein